MCGIAGSISFDAPVVANDVARMLAAIDHRGPDSSGVAVQPNAALGACRLSITDRKGRSDQPMTTECGRFTLVFNGQIYNYRSIREELSELGHKFTSDGDTEVVLRAFVQWGESCVLRFDGMWAFGVWDGIDRILFASRDRFGIKPFYFEVSGYGLHFCSELKGFCAVDSFTAAVDLDTLADYLKHEYVDRSDSTFFGGVKQLLP